MKTIKILLLLALVVLITVFCCACEKTPDEETTGEDTPQDVETEAETGNFKYIESEDGTGYLVSGLTYAPQENNYVDLVIPSTHKGKPVVGIANEAFMNDEYSSYSNISSVMIPNSIKNIGSNAFTGCDNLSTVKFAEDSQLERIGNEAFSFCHNLFDITIPSNVTTIESAAFQYTGLKNVVIEDGNQSLTIKQNVFSGCRNLTYITIPARVTGILSNAFWDCPSLKAVYIKDINAWHNIFFEDRCSTPLCSGSAYLYLNNVKVTSVAFPEGTTQIGYAFSNYVGLISVDIPSSVTSIGEYAFWGCINLINITIPASVKSIGDNAFASCWRLTNVTFAPNSQLQSIGKKAFGSCYNLISMTIPESVISIDSSAFEECQQLMEIYNLSQLNIIKGYGVGKYALNVYTSSMSESNLHTVDDYIFYKKGSEIYLLGYSGSETTLTLPADFEGCTYEIYKYAFYYHNLTSVTLSSGITSIGSHAFQSCKNLTSISISANIKGIDYQAFAFCSNLSNVIIAKNSQLTHVYQGAFAQCQKLTSITFTGSRTEWEAMQRKINYYFRNYTIHCEDGDIPKVS